MTYSFLDEDSLDTEAASVDQPLELEDITSRQDDIRRRLNGYCKGLLEVVSNKNVTVDNYLGRISYPKVEFLHRTVHDFLLLKDMQLMLSHNLPTGFTPKERLCKAYLAQLKKLNYDAFEASTTSSSDCVPEDILEDLLFYVRALEIEVNLPQATLMDEVGRLVSQRPHCFQLSSTDTGYLEYLIHRKVYLYITRVLTREPSLAISTKTVLLAAAMRPRRTKYFSQGLDPVMIGILLKHGASPNIDHPLNKLRLTSVWGDLLHYLNDRTLEVIEEPLLDVIECFLRHGADPEKAIVIETNPVTPQPQTAQATTVHESASAAKETKSAMQILHESLPIDKAKQLQNEYWSKRPIKRDSSPDRRGDEPVTPLFHPSEEECLLASPYDTALLIDTTEQRHS